jgi:pilus assembly protein Flp/PilA
MNKLVQRFLKDGSGVSAIEFGLIVACILIATVAVVKNLGDPLNTPLAGESAAQ